MFTQDVEKIQDGMARQDYLCKWCLTYVGQRRQFCSADCAAQFKICQQRRDRKQDLNISVDYYGRVKLCIQGQPIHSNEVIEAQIEHPKQKDRHRRPRFQKRCPNCARLLIGFQQEYCDSTCQGMYQERIKQNEFLNLFHPKDAAERRRVRKWLLDAQFPYNKIQDGEGEEQDQTPSPDEVTRIPKEVLQTKEIKIRLPTKDKGADKFPEGKSFHVAPEKISHPEKTTAFNELDEGAFQSVRTFILEGSDSYGRLKLQDSGQGHSNENSRQHKIKFSKKKQRKKKGGNSNAICQEDKDNGNERRQLLIDLKWIPAFDD
ncbi:hypothetical protein CHS0354_031698 [Potamilus streckersoni]|uniref:Uncharacterized protein n=1 Tax=Potamilus streckersoni TaxID=2493646 RepID=A0AAE0SS96_9BIVA|nr:hypothetical protein CHS0354_031698 [Potamilus streckersoni]